MLTIFGGRSFAMALWGLVVLQGVPAAVTGQSATGATLGTPGYLVVEDAADTAAGFRWEEGPGPQRRSLVWEEGRLTLPDNLEMEPFGKRDLGIPCQAELAGSGASGQLILRDGIFRVSETVTLSDGRLEMRISGGELEVRGARLRYRRVGTDNRDFKSGLLLLAGMTLLVVVLLRRARLKAGERTDR